MRKRAGIVLAVAGLLPAMLGMLPAPAAAAAPDVPVAPDVSVFSFLNGVITLSPSDAWAVGWAGVAGSTILFAQSFHWNGRQWVSVNAAPGANINGLQSVSATGPSNIWGVGFIGTAPFIERYNGHKWATVPCPYRGETAQLNGVDARTASDAWAVGYVVPGSSSSSVGFAEHWNGRTWAQVKMAPVGGSDVVFNSVLDLGPRNVLAVGDYQTGSGSSSFVHQLAERWNGHVWQRVSLPAISTGSFLMGISGGTSAGVIAVGSTSSGGRDAPLIERWTGTRFVRVAQPVSRGDLNAVTVLSRTNAYAVGDTGTGDTLVEHYNGKRWTMVPSPSPGDGSYLSGVAATPSGSFVVAVGSHGPTLSNRLLIEQGNGRTWHIARQ